MPKRRLPTPTPATVIATAALVAALTGSALGQPPAHLAKRLVTRSQIAPNAIASPQVLDRSLQIRDLGLAARRALQGPQGARGRDATLDGAAAGGDLTGTYPAPTIAGGKVSADKLADGAVTAVKLAASAVGSSAILDGAVAAAKLADGAVSSAKLADGGVDAADIAAAAVTGAKIADNVVAAVDIATGAVGTAEISNGAVGASDLGPSAVTNAKLADNAVGAAEVTDGSLTRADYSVVDTLQSLNPPSIAAHSCTDITFTAGTFSGVHVGDDALFFPVSSVDAHLVVQPLRQNVASQVVMRLCNISAAAVDDGSNFYGIQVLR